MRPARDTLVMLLAGGVGSRLNILASERAKPAVPFGGGFRIIDFTLSNVMHSGLDQAVNEVAKAYSTAAPTVDGVRAGTYGYTASSLEVNLYGGYKGTFAKDFGYDVGAIYYYYPGEQARGSVSPNTTEVYGALSWKWLSAKLSYAVSECFANMDSEGTYYFDVSANVPVAETGLTIQAHAGYLNVAGTPGGVSNDDLYGYTDWKLGVSYAPPKGLTVGAFYTDTNAEEAPYTFSGRNWADKQAAVYVQKTF